VHDLFGFLPNCRTRQARHAQTACLTNCGKRRFAHKVIHSFADTPTNTNQALALHWFDDTSKKTAKRQISSVLRLAPGMEQCRASAVFARPETGL
jgi:hypothetical protein